MARFRPHASSDDGFSLLESVIALAIAAVVFTALASAMVSSMKAVLVGRSVQQAGDVGAEALESLRTQGYDSLAMVPADLSVNDPLGVAGTSKYDPVANLASGSGAEDLVLDDAGGVSPHVSISKVNATTYTIRKYVTRPAASVDSDAKRITVVVSWTQRTETRTRAFSTLVTETRRGLPLPDYKWANDGATAACVSPGGQAVFGFSLTNNGARDAWSLSSTGGSLSWSFYDDTGSASAGAYGTDDAAVSTTGLIDPTQTRSFWAVANPSTSEPVGTSTVTFTATSVAQPTYFQTVTGTLSVASVCTSLPTPTPTATGTGTATPTASASASPSSTATPPPAPTTCSGTVPSANPGGSAVATSYYLRNGATNLADTTASSPLTLGRLAPPTSTALWNYATDLSPGTSGRYLATVGSGLATTQEWRYQFGSSTKLVGTGVTSFWAAPASGNASDAMTFTVTVRKLTSSGAVSGSAISTGAVGSGSWSCAGYKPVGVAVNFGNGSGTSFSANEYVSVTVTVSGAPALLAYDTTAFQSQLVLPVKSGGT